MSRVNCKSGHKERRQSSAPNWSVLLLFRHAPLVASKCGVTMVLSIWGVIVYIWVIVVGPPLFSGSLLGGRGSELWDCQSSCRVAVVADINSAIVVGTLKDGYLHKVPLPWVPCNQSTIPVAASATFPVNLHDTGYSPDPRISLYNNLTRLLLDVSKLSFPHCWAGWFWLATNSIEQPFVYPSLIAIVSTINSSIDWSSPRPLSASIFHHYGYPHPIWWCHEFPLQSSYYASTPGFCKTPRSLPAPRKGAKAHWVPTELHPRLVGPCHGPRCVRSPCT